MQLLAQWSKLHELQGNLQRADQLLERAGAASSARDVELLRVVYLVRRGLHEQALALLESAPELNGEAQLERGRLYDRLGRHPKHGATGCRARRSSRRRRAEPNIRRGQWRCLRAFEAVPGGTNIELLPRAAVREDVPQPVFIMGFPRSGTTLVEQVLGGHSAVRPGGELTFAGEWPQLLRFARRPRGVSGEPRPDLDRRSATTSRASCAITIWRARRNAGCSRAGKAFFTDKMPFNEMWLPLVRMAFPRAKIVRVVRHPLDVCVSMLSHQLTHGFNCAYRIETIVHQLCAMLDLMQHYRRELDPADFTLGTRTSCAVPTGRRSACSTISVAVRVRVPGVRRPPSLRRDAELRAGDRKAQHAISESLPALHRGPRAFPAAARAVARRRRLYRRAGELSALAASAPEATATISAALRVGSRLGRTPCGYRRPGRSRHSRAQ